MLFDRRAYLTRLATFISPEEMNKDPEFIFNGDLPDLSNVHTATAHVMCGQQTFTFCKRRSGWTAGGRRQRLVRAQRAARSTPPRSTARRRWPWRICARKPARDSPRSTTGRRSTGGRRPTTTPSIPAAAAAASPRAPPPACSCCWSRWRSCAADVARGLDGERGAAILATLAPPYEDRRNTTVPPSAPSSLRALAQADTDAGVPDRRLRRRVEAAAGAVAALDGAVAVAATPAAAAPAPAPVDASGFRTAIDLYANRVHAGLQRDGRLVIDAGGLDFLKYVDGGWKTSWLLGEKDEGHPAALVSGLSAMSSCPSTPTAKVGGRRRDTLSITMRALAPHSGCRCS